MLHRLVEPMLCRRSIAFGSQKEIDSFALLVHRALKVFPRAAYLERCLIHPPAFIDGVLVIPEEFSNMVKNRIAERLIDEWSTTTPCSRIIS